MICPHCNTGVKMDFRPDTTVRDANSSTTGISVSHSYCPECKNVVVRLNYGDVISGGAGLSLHPVGPEVIVHPRGSARPVASEVPQDYKVDFHEACNVLPLSPKASAALSRRLLQKVLREHFGIKGRDLSLEIDNFIERKDTPSYLADAIDAIRNIGNFAAHPLKASNTGEIVDVEPGEAEWILEVLESLFDHAFVQPKKLDARRLALDAKLSSLGKPSMKVVSKPTS